MQQGCLALGLLSPICHPDNAQMASIQTVGLGGALGGLMAPPNNMTIK